MLQPLQFTKNLKYSLVAIAPCMTFLLSISITSSPSLAGTPISPFGLGLSPVSDQMGYRCHPPFGGNTLAPVDGGRTLSAQPTFYAYIEKSGEIPKGEPLRITFMLRDGTGHEAISTYRATGLEPSQN
ncbi:hypothetical protein TUMEXPCC7403_20690 [Tumidithrix helvetica PCC 7403]|uniref:hypothetical protein n=1 Tax=Tumidithrix helvetica TaxID=3457545 RepID=UPI003C983866